MSLVGNLKTVSFSDLLQLISTNKKTGMLSVTRSNQEKNLFFDRGEIVSSVTSDQEDWFLSQFLFRKKRIDEKDWDRVLLLSKSCGKRMIDTLAESGLVSRQDIMETLRILIEETVFGIFGWEEAKFEFVEGKLPPRGVFRLKMNTMGIIMEGAKRLDEWSEIQKVLPSNDFCLKPNLNPPVKEGFINLTPDEYHTLFLIDEQKTISEILMESPLGELTTSRSLSSLIANGLIVKEENKTANGNKREEEEVLLHTVFQVYHLCFSLVEGVLTQKLGQGKDQILNRFIDRQKDYYPVTGKLSKRGFLEKETFYLVAKKIPEEIRLHQLLDSLNSALSESLKTLHSILGKNIKNSVSKRIKNEITKLLKNEKWVAEKYELPQEIYRVLDKA